MATNETVSVCIITCNEEKNIKRCLESIKWAREIIIVDSGSTDYTLTLASRYTNRIFRHPWQGFGPQKQYAVSLATSPWILSLDADEVISPELQTEIFETLKSPQYDSYAIPRKNYFGKIWIRHGGWYPDSVIRLFRKGKASLSSDPVHERVISEGPVGCLRHPFLHYTSSDFNRRLEKEIQYGILKAQKIQNTRFPIFHCLLRPFWKFFFLYFIKSGWRDGKIGFLLAFAKSFGVIVTYAKLLTLEPTE